KDLLAVARDGDLLQRASALGVGGGDRPRVAKPALGSGFPVVEKERQTTSRAVRNGGPARRIDHDLRERAGYDFKSAPQAPRLDHPAVDQACDADARGNSWGTLRRDVLSGDGAFQAVSDLRPVFHPSRA